MVSTFDEFQATMVEYPIDIMTMSETWLKNNPLLIDMSPLPAATVYFVTVMQLEGVM